MDALPSPPSRIWSSSFTCCFLANLLVCIAYFPFNPTLPLYLEEGLKFSGSAIGIVVACYAFTALISRPFVGYALDSFSRKTFYILCLIGFVTLFAGFAVATTFCSLMALRCVQGLFWGGVTAGGSTVATDIVPTQRRGEGLSFYGLSMPIAMGIGPIAGMWIYEHLSFDAVWWQALVLGGLGVAVAFGIKSTRNVARLVTTKKSFSFKNFLYIRALPCSLVMLLVAFPQGNAISYAGMHGKTMGFPNPSLYYVMLSIGAIVSRLFVGKNMDKGFLRQIMSIALIFLIMAYTLLSVTTHHHLFLLAGLFAGIGFGMIMPSLITMVMNLAQPEDRGKANGTFFTFMDLGFGAGILCGGIIHEHLSLHAAFGVAASVDTLALIAVLTFAYPHYAKMIRLKLR